MIFCWGNKGKHKLIHLCTNLNWNGVFDSLENTGCWPWAFEMVHWARWTFFLLEGVFVNNSWLNALPTSASEVGEQKPLNLYFLMSICFVNKYRSRLKQLLCSCIKSQSWLWKTSVYAGADWFGHIHDHTSLPVCWRTTVLNAKRDCSELYGNVCCSITVKGQVLLLSWKVHTAESSKRIFKPLCHRLK